MWKQETYIRLSGENEYFSFKTENKTRMSFFITSTFKNF